MIRGEIIEEYFEWLCNIVCHDRFSKDISYEKILSYLHSVEFRWSIPKDRNRCTDGISLRRKFAKVIGYDELDDYLDGPCSVLEMMIALAIRCEDIMDNPNIGDRTGQWFWGMMVSLGLGSMSDRQFDEDRADNVINRFLDRKYDTNGRGGLFTVRNCTRDLRKVEIWIQMLWYLDNFV